jgi:hypothetical protein
MLMLDVLRYEPQTVSLICLLLLSFVLPITASKATTEKAVQLAWSGQSLLAVAGLAVLMVPRYSYVALGFAAVGCGIFAYVVSQLMDRVRVRATK